MKESKLLLSIIIPMYNTAKYIKRCLDSCYAQGLSEDEFEIIVVDDGSTDDSYSVVEQIGKAHTNLRLLHQRNQRQGAARNNGMNVAKGRYVAFVDSDDFLLQYSIGTVLETACRQNADMCSYLMNVQDSNGNWSSIAFKDFVIGKAYSGEEVLLSRKNQGCSCCSCLFRLEFLNEYNLRFIPGIIDEDVEFMIKVQALAKRMIFTNQLVYIYEYNASSTTRELNYDKVKKRYLDNIVVSKGIINAAIDYPFISDRLKSFLHKQGNSVFLGAFIQLFLSKDANMHGFLKDFIYYSKKIGLAPLSGKGLTWKTSLIIPFFNLYVRYLFH